MIEQSKVEINMMCKALLEEHRDKLKDVEIAFISHCQHKGVPLEVNELENLTGMYHRLIGDE